MATTIETLWKKTKNKSEIARLSGHDWKTVDKIIKELEKGNKYPQKKPHSRLLDPHKEKIVGFIEQGLSGVRIHEELAVIGVSVGYTTVRDYLKLIKGTEKIFVFEKLFCRLNILSGEINPTFGRFFHAITTPDSLIS